MKRLQIAAKLAGVIENHKVRSLGPLWAESFSAFPASAGFFRLEAPKGIDPLGTGALQDGGQQLLPVVSFLDRNLFPSINIFHDVPNEEFSASEWVDAQMKSAKERRQALIEALPKDGAFRLINGRRDSLPGLTVDIYGNHAVIGISSAYWKQDLDLLKKFIREAVPSTHSIRYCDHSAKDDRKPNSVYTSTYLTGKSNPASIVVEQVFLLLISMVSSEY
jgi:23S rRNA G2069 N7-methylase RlmK/C1962 C5-methylase RlmI